MNGGRPLLFSLFAALFASGSVACGALDEFEHTMEDEATIPGRTTNPGPFTVGYMGGFRNVDLTASKSFQNAGVTPDDVDAIFVKKARVEGKNPTLDRLDVIINSIQIYVEAPGVERKTIATVMNIPQNSSAVDLVVDDKVNLKPYATAPSMQVGATVDVKQQPAFDTTIKTTITLLVDINLLGS